MVCARISPMTQMDLVGNKNPRNLRILQPHQISKPAALQKNRIPDRLYVIRCVDDASVIDIFDHKALFHIE